MFPTSTTLPLGWVEKIDEKSGKTYFVNRYVYVNFSGDDIDIIPNEIGFEFQELEFVQLSSESIDTRINH